MTYDFILPMSKDDLLNKTGINQYVVDEIYPLRQIPERLQECMKSHRNNGPLAILTHFDSLFSMLCHLKNLESVLREDIWSFIIKDVSSYVDHGLPKVLDDINLDKEDKHKYLNALKMNCYLLCKFTEYFESEATKPLALAPLTGKGRTKSRKKTMATSGFDWDEERVRAVHIFSKVIHLNIHRLWDPPVVEEEFINLLTSCCYKLLENPDVTKNITCRDAIFHVLGAAVKKYNHSLGASLKMIQLLQHFEHLVSPLAQAVHMIVSEYTTKTVVSEILREISRMDCHDLSRDTSGTRALSQFLVELSEKVPSVVLPSISVLLTLLDGESYSMRNSILGVIGEIVIRVLSEENLDTNLKNTRNQLLDILEDHIHDVHAFTRSKVLQIWINIVSERVLPLPRQPQVVDLVIERLRDKSSQVRKYAIQLITTLLQSNPFAAKLPVEELKANYENEKAKLSEMMPDQPVPPDVPDEILEEWNQIEMELKEAINSHNGETAEEDNLVDEDEDVTCILGKVYEDLKAKEYPRAITLLQVARQTYPGHHLFTSSVDEDESDTIMQTLKATFFDCSKEPKDPNEDIDKVTEEVSTDTQDTNVVNEVTKQQVLVLYLKDSLTFASQIQKAVPIISQLLGSKSITDVMEAIEFFVTGFEFGVSNSMLGIRRMLSLVWSQEKRIKEAVTAAYKRLYLKPEGNNIRLKAQAVVNNLIALTSGATHGDLTSLEELVCEFVRSDDITGDVIKMLWEKFAMKLPSTTTEESRGALTLLGMAAGAKIDIVRSNVDVLVKEGLGTRAAGDFMLVEATCLALNKLGNGKAKAGSYTEPFRFPQDHEIFTRLSEILVTGISDVSQYYWVPMAEQAINVIYKLAEFPDKICGEIIKRLVEIIRVQYAMSFATEPVVGNGESLQADVQDKQCDPNEETTEDNHTTGQQGSCPPIILTRLFSVSGHIALRQLVHLDVAVLGEMKRRHAIREEEGSKSKDVDSSKAKQDGETIEEELGLTGAAAEDAEAEYIRRVTDNDVVSGQNMLALLRPLLVTVCNNESQWPDPELRASATLALAKFMMVSSEFCENHLQLLFTVLEKSPSATIRANTIIALGDLTFRFPNLIEPWTPNLYARLRDESCNVRKNTLMMLTHLILNDMVKVKGQISEMATCIVDYDGRIAGLAKLFFHELSKKGNAIYNIMPDVISRLSDVDACVDEDNFRIIMKYLFSFIQKDKQCESLVEKLCHRFRAARNERQWRDYAFCLSMLSYSEKSIRKLQENFVCFSDKLSSDQVYSCFVTIISGAKKFAKPETKSIVEELEQRLETCHSKGQEDDQAAQKAAAATKKGRGKTPGRKAGKTPAASRRRKKDDSEEEKSEEDDFQPVPTKRKNEKKIQHKLSFSSDEESDIELFDVDKSGTNDKEEECEEIENRNPNIDFSPIIRKQKKSVNSKKHPVSTRKSTRSSVKTS